MSGLFASLSAGRALEKISSFLRAFSAPPPVPSSSSSSVQDDLEELRKLERTLHRIRATLHDAEEHWNIREESAKLRLKELKQLAYEMEDVVDEYEYEVNRCKTEGEALQRSACSANYTGNGKRKHREENRAYPEDEGRVAVPYELVLRTRKITERFNEIIHYADNFSLSENDGERRFTPDISRSRHTSSFVSEKSIVGRDQLRDTIVEKLLSGSRQNVGKPVSVMAIVGMGGLGKTTLAQLVYNDPRVDRSFPRRAYVYVSEEFDVITITRNIINSIIANDKKCGYSELDELHGQHLELDELHCKLAYVIKDKRSLVVLDDVWNDKRRDWWESLCAPMSAARFCQIILTTRSNDVARLAQAMPSYRPSCLSFDVSWSLFKQVAFQVDQESDAPVNLIHIGKSIAQKCKGLPLAIKTIGSMLRYETDEERWKDVLESELWDLEPSQHEILPALELSYKHMPICLRRCFLALSLFPKVSSLKRYDVMQTWKVLDLLHGNGSKEKIGWMYLNELVQRSILLLDVNDGEYFLHDLLHDLACFLAGEEFYRFGGGTSTKIIPQNVRYMSLTCDSISMKIQITSHSLRAIIVETCVYNPEALVLNCKKLRALDFSCHADAFPVIMDSLKLLRHISARVSGSTQFVMPTSMLRLYNLQTLELCWYNEQTGEMFLT